MGRAGAFCREPSIRFLLSTWDAEVPFWERGQGPSTFAIIVGRRRRRWPLGKSLVRSGASSSYGRTIWIFLLDIARHSTDLGLRSTVQRSLAFLERCRVFFRAFSKDATFSRRERTSAIRR